MARNFDVLNMYKKASAAMIKRRASVGPFDTATAIDQPTRPEIMPVETAVPQNTQTTTPVISTPNPAPVPIQANNRLSLFTGSPWATTAPQVPVNEVAPTATIPIRRIPIGEQPVAETNYGGVPREPAIVEQGRLVSGTNQVDNLNVNLENARARTQAFMAQPQIQTPSTVPGVMDRAEEIKARMAFSRLPSRQQQAIRTQQRLAESSANQTAEFQARMKAKTDEKAADIKLEQDRLDIAQAGNKREEELQPSKVAASLAAAQASSTAAAEKAEDRPEEKKIKQAAARKAEADAKKAEMDVEIARDMQEYNKELKSQEVLKARSGGITQAESQREYQAGQVKLYELRSNAAERLTSMFVPDKDGKISPVESERIVELTNNLLTMTPPEEQPNVRSSVLKRIGTYYGALDAQIQHHKKMISTNKEAAEDDPKLASQLLAYEYAITGAESEKKALEEAKKSIENSAKTIVPPLFPKQGENIPNIVTQSGIDALAPGDQYVGMDGKIHVKPVPGQTHAGFIAEHGL